MIEFQVMIKLNVPLEVAEFVAKVAPERISVLLRDIIKNETKDIDLIPGIREGIMNGLEKDGQRDPRLLTPVERIQLAIKKHENKESDSMPGFARGLRINHNIKPPEEGE